MYGHSCVLVLYLRFETVAKGVSRSLKVFLGLSSAILIVFDIAPPLTLPAQSQVYPAYCNSEG